MSNFVMWSDAELAAWHLILLWLTQWTQGLEFGKEATATHARAPYTPPLGTDADTQVALTLARLKIINLTK